MLLGNAEPRAEGHSMDKQHGHHPEHPYAPGAANPQPQNPSRDDQDLTGNVRNAKSRLTLHQKPVLIRTGKQTTFLSWSTLWEN